MDWYQVKAAIAVATGLHMDALHVHAGVLGQLAAALVLRRSLGSIWPWLAVAAALALNEWFDLGYERWPSRPEQYAATWKDVWNTMLLPTILMLLVRYYPRLLAPAPRKARRR